MIGGSHQRNDVHLRHRSGADPFRRRNNGSRGRRCADMDGLAVLGAGDVLDQSAVRESRQLAQQTGTSNDDDAQPPLRPAYPVEIL